MTRLSLVIPAYNEAARLEATLAGATAYLSTHQRSYELILVDDGSTDATLEVATRAAASDEHIRVFANATNLGKGAAVRRGIANSTGSVVGFTDADLAYALDYIEPALTALNDGADLVLGQRDLPAAKAYSMPRLAATHVFNSVVERTLRLGVVDIQCGFKWARGDVGRELFRELTVDGFAFDVELLWLARAWGLRVDTVPVAMRASDRSAVRLVQDGATMLREVVRLALRRPPDRAPRG